MVKTFYKCLHALIYSSRRNGFKKGKLVVWYRKEVGRDVDYLDIFRTRPNSYVVHFDSHIEGNSWWHRDVPLRLVVSAVKSFEEATLEGGRFEY